MTLTADSLPLVETRTPVTPAELSSIVAECAGQCTAVYPLGGCTSLGYGLRPKQPGIGLSLAGLDRVIDYPARDMTITVEAGITLAQLAQTLAAERQWLPLDAPQAERATLGGLVATGWSGQRRYANGTPRDYVIGISAVDGRGIPFKGGGRVVKNVAGYDFCKLLTGSLGTLGVITQITLKIRPLPQQSAIVSCSLDSWSLAETLLAGLTRSATTPSAVELLCGPAWNEMLGPLESGAVARLLVGLEGTPLEVAWMIEQLGREWCAAGASAVAMDDPQVAGAWRGLTEFSAAGEAPLVIKASLRPSGTVEFVSLVREIDPQASIQAHAGNGIVIARFADFPSAAISRVLIGRLQPAALAHNGHITVLSAAVPGEITRQAAWGGVTVAHVWMNKVKQQFDPHDILNPGRFVFAKS